MNKTSSDNQDGPNDWKVAKDTEKELDNIQTEPLVTKEMITTSGRKELNDEYDPKNYGNLGFEALGREHENLEQELITLGSMVDQFPQNDNIGMQAIQRSNEDIYKGFVAIGCKVDQWEEKAN